MKLHAASRELLEYAYTQAIEMHELTAPNFLGLAEIRLREEKVQEGTALLKRLTLVVGEPNENLDAAAALLEKTGHNGDAMPFLERLVAAQPWNFDARVRLGKIELWRGNAKLRHAMIFAALRAILILLTSYAQKRRRGLRAAVP